MKASQVLAILPLSTLSGAVDLPFKDRIGGLSKSILTPFPQQEPIQPHNMPDASSNVRLSDVIGKSQAINIFGGFTRDVEEVSRRLDDAAQNATILAPSNQAIMQMPRKPWEDPKDYAEFGASVYNGESGAEKAHENLKRFVEAHIVDASPWKEKEKRETLTGKTIWFEMVDGKTMVNSAFGF